MFLLIHNALFKYAVFQKKVVTTVDNKDQCFLISYICICTYVQYIMYNKVFRPSHT